MITIECDICGLREAIDKPQTIEIEGVDVRWLRLPTGWKAPVNAGQTTTICPNPKCQKLYETQMHWHGHAQTRKRKA